MMTAQLQFMMDKHQRTKGFTLLEMMISLLILSIFTNIFFVYRKFELESYYRFPSNYLLTQSQSILDGQQHYLNDYGYNIYFSGKGNVNHAQTIHFYTNQGNKEIIIELGFGKLVFR